MIQMHRLRRYADGMIEHDRMVGQVLAKLKELGLEDNTIVRYATDNDSESFPRPNGGTTMFRGEKATNWEGGYRVPTAIHWPGVIKPATAHQWRRRARGHFVAVLLLIPAGLFGDLGLIAVPLGLVDLAIGLVYMSGLPKELGLSHQTLLCDHPRANG